MLFHFLDIKTNVVANSHGIVYCMHLCSHFSISRGFGSSRGDVFNFLKNCQVIIHNKDHHTAPVVMYGIFNSSHPIQLLPSVFSITAILVREEYNPSVILICISLMTNNSECLFMCILPFTFPLELRVYSYNSFILTHLLKLIHITYYFPDLSVQFNLFG